MELAIGSISAVVSVSVLTKSSQLHIAVVLCHLDGKATFLSARDYTIKLMRNRMNHTARDM